MGRTLKQSVILALTKARKPYHCHDCGQEILPNADYWRGIGQRGIPITLCDACGWKREGIWREQGDR